MLPSLIRFCVSRRLPVLVGTLAIAAYGVRAYLATPVEAYPDVTNLQVSVIAQLPGLAPEEIERQVTVPLERVLNGTPGMLMMRSESLFGLSLIALTFEDGADPFRSRVTVYERIADADMSKGADVSLADVTGALERSNRNVGGEFLRHGDQELTIRGVGYLTDAQDVQAIVLSSREGTPVRIGDVARVVASHTPSRGTVGYNLDTNVAEGFALLRRGENPSTVLDGIHAKVEELNATILPKGMRIEPFYDRTTLVSETLSTVHHNLLFGALLVIAVVWLFLRSVRCSLIVASVIPLALLTA